ncbi:MAG: hypothetical protein V7K68_28230 [Nostoc sp.]|uniref:hypothetical protein n=1 Tax=Nostoc sp. TaxID=1180 RepID=UPI002FF78ABF
MGYKRARDIMSAYHLRYVIASATKWNKAIARVRRLLLYETLREHFVRNDN